MMNQNPYDFILADRPKKRFSFNFKQSGGKTKLLLAIIGIVVGLIILIIALSLAFGSNNNTVKLYELAAAQQDLIGLTANNSIQDTTLANKATTYELVVSSQANSIESYLKEKGIKGLSKKIIPYKDTHYKNALEEANTSGNYDEVFKALLANKADAYRVKLQAAYAGSKGKLKDLLANQYSEISDLSSN